MLALGVVALSSCWAATAARMASCGVRGVKILRFPPDSVLTAGSLSPASAEARLCEAAVLPMAGASCSCTQRTTQRTTQRGTHHCMRLQRAADYSTVLSGLYLFSSSCWQLAAQSTLVLTRLCCSQDFAAAALLFTKLGEA